MFVFPANDESYRKRKKSFKACEQCKKGRRRCQSFPRIRHGQCTRCAKDNIQCTLMTLPLSELPNTPSSLTSQQEENLVRLQSTERPTTQIMTSISAVIHASDKEIEPPLEAIPLDQEGDTATRKFISNLDPASDLVMVGDPDKDKVGIWVHKNAEHSLLHTSKKPVMEFPALNAQLLTYLNTQHAFDLPDQSDRAGLLKIYFTYINSILPIVDEQIFFTQYNNGGHSTLLLLAIMLAACRHRKAEKFLHETDPRTFAAATHRKLNALLYAEMEQDPLTLVRIHALMSFHSEGPNGLDQGAKNLGLAFHYAHTLGIHLKYAKTGSTQTGYSEPRQKLWTSLWCLDRMSTCVNGRPHNSDPTDVSIQLIDKTVEGCEELAMITDACQSLDQAIELYRPKATRDALPEKKEFRKSDFLPRLLNLVAIILSYRTVQGRTASPQVPESAAETLLVTSLELLSIVEKASMIAPLPVIPYSVSLTLGIFLSQFPKLEACAGWERACAILDRFGQYWWIAEAMSSLGRRVFQRLNGEFASLENEPARPNAEIPNGPTSSVLEQASLFGGLDRDAADFWFQNMTGFEEFQAMMDAEFL
ncbi:hypothetical protein V1514DRAFT_327531 [Lipomyces japonicus]|uniref:uncharacterized protein n=1 Tax=Lipomyces japonicus TaxID=56871 RepID=UPI0034CFA879